MNASHTLSIVLKAEGVAETQAGFQQVANSTKGSALALQSLANVGSIVGQQVFPQAASTALNLAHVLQQLNTAARAAGSAFGPIAVGVAAVTAAVGIGTAAWGAYKASMQEATSGEALHNQQLDLRKRLLAQIRELDRSGKISHEEATRMGTKLIEGNDDTLPARIGSVQNRLRDVVGNTDQSGAVEKLRELNRAAVREQLEGYDKERVAAHDLYDQRIKEIEALAKAAGNQLKPGVVEDSKALAAETRDDSLAKAKAKRDEADQQTRESAERLTEEIEASSFRQTESAIANLYREQFEREQIVEQEIEGAEEKERLLTLIAAEYTDKRIKLNQDAARVQVEDERRAAERKKLIERERNDALEDILVNAAGAARQFGREGFIAYKTLAIAKVAIDTAQAAMGAYNSVVGIPYVGVILAPIAAGAAVAFGVAQSAAIAGQSYAVGGFTGGTEGQPAGIVHGQEFVFSAPAVDRVGLGNLEALHSGGSMTTTATASQEPPVINLAILNSESQIPNWARSTEGQNHILDVVQKNWHKLG